MKPRFQSSLPSPLFTACPPPPPPPPPLPPQQQQQQQHHQHQQPAPSSRQTHSGAPPSINQPSWRSHRRGQAAKHNGADVVTRTGSSSSDSSDSSDNTQESSTGGQGRSRRRERPVGVRARVLFNFEANGPSELSVISGQQVRALYHVDKRWLFVLTRLGNVGYIPFLYAAKESWGRWRPVPSMRRYCRGLSPPSPLPGQPASRPQSSIEQSATRLCLPDDLSRPPALEPPETNWRDQSAAASNWRLARPSSLRLDQTVASLRDWRLDELSVNGSRGPPALEISQQPSQQLTTKTVERPRRSSFDSAVASSAASAAPTTAKRRVTFRPDAEVIGTADSMDRQPIYHQVTPRRNSTSSGKQCYLGQSSEPVVNNKQIECIKQTLV